IGCRQVAGSLVQCLTYLNSAGPGRGVTCNGVRSLNSMAMTPTDRQVVCNCLKFAASSVIASSLGKAVGIPGECGISIPYKISPSIDC
ncbi:hypothetical protein NMG60_11035933, partial [Bertholletia excelsa]